MTTQTPTPKNPTSSAPADKPIVAPQGAKAPEAKPLDKKSGVKPAVAVHSIVHGEGERTEPGGFFIASSAAERKELLDIGAIREIEDEAEQALYEKIAASKTPDLG